MYLSLRKKVEAIAIANDITFQELAELIGLDELTLVYYLEDGHELPVISLAKMSQVLNFNFFSLFRFNEVTGTIDVLENCENSIAETFLTNSDTDTQEPVSFLDHFDLAVDGTENREHF
jgi:DNA-binding XRE family transcriptional regulator